jgi:hypothetical protein
VLNKGLECAIDVNKFRRLAVIKGADKMLPNAKKWAELDDDYWAQLKEIWEPKEVKTGV